MCIYPNSVSIAVMSDTVKSLNLISSFVQIFVGIHKIKQTERDEGIEVHHDVEHVVVDDFLGVGGRFALFRGGTSVRSTASILI